MPPIDPSSDHHRIETLRSLRELHGRREAFTDSITAAAAWVADTPISAITMVDEDRQWFQSATGLDAVETELAVSFCAQAIRLTEPTVVRDAREDARFAHNPLVTGAPYIRFYAGIPLQVAGHALGTLCVIDTRPRTLTPTQIEQLLALASTTEIWLNRFQQNVR